MKITWENADDFELIKTAFRNKKTGKRGWYLQEHCKVCGDPFFSRSKNAVICSKECTNIRTREEQSNSYEDVKKCIESVQGYKLLSKEYKNLKTKLKIQCDKGHSYYTLLWNFQHGNRCPYCSKNPPVTWDDILQLFNKHDLEVLSKEKDFKTANHTKIKFRCRKCGYEHKITFSHLKYKNKFECPRCNNKEYPIKIYFSEIKKWFEDENWIVLSKEEDYVDQNSTPIHCICPKGHEQYKSVRKWRLGRRCQYCNTSGPELQVRKFIKTLGINVLYNDRKAIYPIELDFYFPDLNKAIEFNGDYWHCNPKMFKEDYLHKHKQLLAKEIWDKDNNKKEKCNEKGIELFTLWNYDWEHDPEIKNKIKDFLK